jgi:endonuclease/exonuclease/phosphatase (EEP) superfamily protein YafD
MVRGQAGKIFDAPETAAASDHRPLVAVFDLKK